MEASAGAAETSGSVLEEEELISTRAQQQHEQQRLQLRCRRRGMLPVPRPQLTGQPRMPAQHLRVLRQQQQPAVAFKGYIKARNHPTPAGV